MNTTPPTPGTPASGPANPTPPPIPQMKGADGQPMLGMDPTDTIPVAGVSGAMEAILRQPRRVVQQLRLPNAGGLIVSLLVVGIVCALIYGFVTGSFSGAAQYWAAPVKVVSGMLLSAVICLPSLYIFACMGGSKARLIELTGLLAGLIALMALLLAGFAPVAWVFSQSTDSIVMMGILHLFFWMIAAVFALRFMHQGVALLGTRSLAGLHVWALIFILVMLQMSTALRPLIGTADTFLPKEKRFFLGHWIQCVQDACDKPRKNAD